MRGLREGAAVTLGRRQFLGKGAAAIAAATLPMLYTRRARAGLGPLQRDPNNILDLPAGFSYTVLERAGMDMSDGYRVPALPDGMACFPGPPGTVVLMRNHEIGLGDDERGPYRPGQAIPNETYRRNGRGGVSRVVLDAQTFRRISSNLVLIGTARNCAGGVSPWGWLTCEETLEPEHGYVFVCSPGAETVRPPQRVRGYGRFRHEAAAVDPKTLDCYLTEDRPDGCFYRFRPDHRDRPFDGKLYAMRVIGRPELDTGRLRVADRVDVDWVPIPDPDPGSDVLREQAQDSGAAVVRRGEGLWIHDGAVYFTATTGGPMSSGQLFRLLPGLPTSREPDVLEVIAEATDPEILDSPDNVTVAPWGGVFLVEDGTGGNHIRGITSKGEVFDFGRNAMSAGEMAGICFDPSGQAMFLNLQQDGVTIAVTGPFVETFAGAASGYAGPPVVDASSRVHVEASGCGCRSAAPAVGLGALAAVTAAGLALHRRRARAR
jgi:hypothetical protein